MVSMILRRRFNKKMKKYGIELYVRKKNSERVMLNPEKVFKEISKSWLSYGEKYKLFVEYMKLLNKTRVPNKGKIATKLLNHLRSTHMICDSDILIHYVYIRRQTKDLDPMTSVIKICEDLRIHRPSFKTFATLLTTYATNAMDAKIERKERIADENVHNMKDCLDYFINKLKYHPNTYLFNFVLNAYNKLKLRYEFWFFYVDIVAKERKKSFKEENMIIYDLYTWCSLFKQCVNEQNPEKFDQIHEKFDPNDFSDKPMGFYRTLVRKMKVIRRAQMKDKFLFEFEKRRICDDNIWIPNKSEKGFTCFKAM